jgi:Crp-like helix-turn-helix protein
MAKSRVPECTAGRAVVQIEGLSSQISVAAFRAAVDRSDGIRDIIVRYNDAHMALIQQSAGCNALHHAEKRLCRWLLQTRDRSDSDVLTLTQEFLAQMLGVQRTSVTLVARHLQADGLISYRRGRIEIIDRSGLEKRDMRMLRGHPAQERGCFFSTGRLTHGRGRCNAALLFQPQERSAV